MVGDDDRLSPLPIHTIILVTGSSARGRNFLRALTRRTAANSFADQRRKLDVATGQPGDEPAPIGDPPSPPQKPEDDRLPKGDRNAAQRRAQRC